MLILAFTFNTFCCGFHAQALAETNDRLNDFGLLFVGFERTDEAPIDLDLVERNVGQL